MTRETNREFRKATKEERELRRVAEEHAALITRQAFAKEIPGRMMLIQLRAVNLGIFVTVALDSKGPVLELQRETPFFEERLTMDTEEWEFDHVERMLTEMEENAAAALGRHSMALDVWEHKLTPQERAAVKEFIYQLPSR